MSTTALFTKLNANSKSVRRQAEDCIKTSKLNWTILHYLKKPLIKSEQIMRLNEDKNFDYSDTKEAFDYNPISFDEGITKEVALYRQIKN